MYPEFSEQTRWFLFETLNSIFWHIICHVKTELSVQTPWFFEAECTYLTVLAVADPVLSIGVGWAAMWTPIVSPTRVRPCVKGHGLTIFHVVTSCETHSPVLLCGFKQEFLLGQASLHLVRVKCIFLSFRHLTRVHMHKHIWKDKNEN